MTNFAPNFLTVSRVAMITDIFTLTLTVGAIAFYLGATGYLISLIRKQDSKQNHWIAAFAFCPTALHCISLSNTLFTENGVQLGILNAASLVSLMINIVVLASSLKKPLHTLLVFQFPLSALLLLGTLLSPASEVSLNDLNPSTVAHILLSFLAYSLLIVATLHSLILAHQNHQLRNHHITGLVKILPPLQTMEALLFELLWVGEILLTLAIATGFLFLEDLFAQHLAHKTVFSIAAWCIYATLLWGRHAQGWRGTVALRWTLGGFCALMLAYFGSKFVLEILL